MSTPFLGEIKMISWNYAPKGWAFCNGALLPINQNQALFSILGTMYGGNGQTTFALPNLQGRTPIHLGQGFTQGQVGGEASHTLIMSEMPAHTHFPTASSALGTSVLPTNNLLAVTPDQRFSDQSANGTMNAGSVLSVGGSQPHNNLSPYLVVNFVIALNGIFPSQN